jgi:hypothetical protein
MPLCSLVRRAKGFGWGRPESIRASLTTEVPEERRAQELSAGEAFSTGQ